MRDREQFIQRLEDAQQQSSYRLAKLQGRAREILERHEPAADERASSRK